jgi:hypothetical protein
MKVNIKNACICKPLWLRKLIAKNMQINDETF